VRLVKYFCLASLLLLVAACSSNPELSVEEEKWTYEVRAINLVLKAVNDVNSVSGRPHSIVVGLFQMSDPNTFSGLSVTREGAVELLQKGKIDETIVDFRLLTMRPGEQKKVSVSRAEAARYIGVIAGYFKLNPKTDVKIFSIPIREVERGLVEKSLAATSMISDQAKAAPGKLNIIVDLGRIGSRKIVAIEDEILRENLESTENEESQQQEGWFDTLKSDSVETNE
jgi:type VI secretion system VasD/TssJ family lipoprotein